MAEGGIQRTVTFPRDLFEQISQLAETERRSFANAVMYVLAKGLEKLEEERGTHEP